MFPDFRYRPGHDEVLTGYLQKTGRTGKECFSGGLGPLITDRPEYPFASRASLFELNALYKNVYQGALTNGISVAYGRECNTC
jgi:hypothetical protein